MKISINVEKALEAVKRNKDKHIHEYQAAYSKYEKDVADEKERRSKKRGGEVTSFLRPPENLAPAFDIIISILENHTAPTLHLDSIEEYKAIMHGYMNLDFAHRLTYTYKP